MPPTGWRTGNRNTKLTQRLANWTDKDGTGIAFDSSSLASPFLMELIALLMPLG